VFDIGFWELLVILSLGLVILGPERLPRVAAQLGNWAGQARRMANMLMTQLRQEIDIEDRARHPGAPPPGSQPKSWNRPGVDDLKPGAASSAPADADAAPAPGADSPAEAPAKAAADHDSSDPDRSV